MVQRCSRSPARATRVQSGAGPARVLTDRFDAEEHRRFCEFLDRATATLIEQTPAQK
ncbi:MULTISPECIES: hypothetical protein [Kitasatospora]|nr:MULTISPECIES: hypothetical protein [Kitasatospora]